MRNNKYIKSYYSFNRINEITEFNLQRMNPDSFGLGQPNVPDNSLSINAFDKHQDAIRVATSRINGILHSLSNTPQFAILKSKLSLEQQDITAMKVLRISKSNGVNYDVFISFIIGEQEYWGVIEGILDEDPVFKSEVFKDTDLVLSKEWIIKTKGLIIKIVKKWLTPDNDMYRLINNEVFCYNVNSGKLLRIIKDTVVNVVRSYDNKIVIKHDNDYYNLIGDSYIYFNYWFSKIA